MNIFAFLNKSTTDDSIRRTGTDVVAQLTERNRKFEAFLLEKLADLESKIIPAEPSAAPPLEDDLDLETPHEAPVAPEAESWDTVADTLLTGTLLGTPTTATPDTPPEAVVSTPVTETHWLAGFDEKTPPPTDDNPPTAGAEEALADVDEGLPADDGEKAIR